MYWDEREMRKWQLHQVISFQLLMLGWVAHPPTRVPRKNRIIVADNLFIFQIWKESLHFSLPMICSKAFLLMLITYLQFSNHFMD